MPLSTILGAFGLALLLPALVFGGYLLSRYADLERARTRSFLANSVDVHAANVYRELTNSVTMLRVLAGSDALVSGDLVAFHANARFALTGSDAFVLVLDLDGRQLVNTRMPFGSDLGMTSDPLSVSVPLERLGPYISNVFTGRVAQQPVFNVAYPVLYEGTVRYILVLTRNAVDVAAWLGDDLAEPFSGIWLVDAEGSVVTGHPYDAALADHPLPADMHEAVLAADGSASLVGSGDDERLVLTSRVGLADWRVIAEVPLNDFNAAANESWRLLAGGAILLVLLTVAVAVLLGHVLSRPIRRLAFDAREFGKGREVHARQSILREVNEVSQALAHGAAERIERSRHIELLMRELVHRAKNQLAIVQSMARLVARRSDTVDAFHASFLPRLEGLGRSIDAMVSQEWKGARLDELVAIHLEAFADDGGSARFAMDGPRLVLRPTAAERLGLCLHELATNATKYGAWSVPDGLVTVEWRVDETADGPVVTIRWTESGGPPVGEPGRAGFGQVLLRDMLASSLKAEVDIDYPVGGLVWRLTCGLGQLCDAPPPA